jgi:hypothetical protein
MIFKSALRRRIEAKRVELTKEMLRLEDEKRAIKQTLNPAEYAKLFVKQCEIKDKIKLLTELL